MTTRRRNRLLLFAACVLAGGVIGWRWGAPEQEPECAVCERPR